MTATRPAAAWRFVPLPAWRFVPLPAWRFVLLAAGLALLTGDAAAQSLDEAMAAYTEGRFLEAAALAEAAGTSDGYSLAARSLAVHGHYVATDAERDELLERAVEMGERAVLADSADLEAQVAYAHALGRRAQSAGAMTAIREGIAGKVRDVLMGVLAADPDHAIAHMALASWHADLDAAGRVARWMYGGSKEDAVFHFERALELAPDSKVVLMEYGVRLARLDEESGRERAREMLERALDLPVRDVYDDFVHLAVLDGLDALEGR